MQTLEELCIGIDPSSMHRPPLWAKMIMTIMLQPPKSVHQWSVNDFWSCILDNPRAMECLYPIINLSAGFTGKNTSDDIASASHNQAPVQRQQSGVELSRLRCDELYQIVTELSLTWSVFSICRCIQLHKYTSNVSQISLFLLVAVETISKNPHCTLL